MRSFLHFVLSLFQGAWKGIVRRLHRRGRERERDPVGFADDGHAIPLGSTALAPGYQEADRQAAEETVRGAGSADDSTRAERESFLQGLRDLAAGLATDIGDTTTRPRVDVAAEILAPGTRLGPYRIDEKIGGGGMGDVFRAVDTREIGRVVAIKVLKPNIRQSDVWVRRFRREKAVNGRVDDLGIVPTYDVGEDRGWQYIVLKYFPEGSLEKHVPPGSTLGEREAATLLARVARAIHHCHQRGVIHRDLKPSNILLDDQRRPHVSDFGLARLLDSDDDCTEPGAPLGTYLYMAPEQIRDAGHVGAGADIYGLGATLYRIITGRPPFQSGDFLQTLTRMRFDSPESPRKLNPRISRDLEAICLKCLEKAPSSRYATAEALAEELERVEQGLPTQTRRISPVKRFYRWTRRRPLVASLLGALALLGLVSLLVVTYLWLDAERGREALRRGDYLRDIALAAEYLEGNRPELAQPLLDGCPERERGLEWKVLWHWLTNPPSVLSGPRVRPTVLAFSPGSPVLVCAGRSGFAETWDPTSAAEGQALEGLSANAGIEGAAWLRPRTGAECIVLATHDGQLVFWDRRGAEWVASAETAQAPGALCMAGSAAGGRIVVGTEVGSLLMWELPSMKPKAIVPEGAHSHTRGVALSRDGTLYATTGDDRRVWVGRFGEMPLDSFALPDTGQSVAFSPEGDLLAVGVANGQLLLWDVRRRVVVKEFNGHNDRVNSLAFSADGSRLASGGDDGRVKMWDVETGRETLSLKVASLVSVVAFSADGRFLAAASDDGPAMVWDTAAAAPVVAADTERIHESRDTIVTLAVSRNGRLACGANDGAIHVMGQGGEDARVVGDSGPSPSARRKVKRVEFSSDGTRLASFGRDGVIRLWDSVTCKQLTNQLSLEDWGGDIAYGPKDHLLACVTQDGRVLLWDSEKGGVPQDLGSFSGEAYALAFDPKERFVATAGMDQTVWLWTLGGGDTARIPLYGHAGSVEDLAFSPDGRYLASVGDDRIAIVWDLERKVAVQRLTGHASRIWGAAFSPDGEILATAGGDGRVILWDVRSGMRVAALMGLGSGRFCAVAFSPDGRYVYAGGGGENRGVWRWELPQAPDRGTRAASP